MPSPFYNLIKGTTAGAPGTGAFTPNAAAADGFAWSTVPAPWMGLVLFKDGTAKQLSYSYWNGTTLSRGANQVWPIGEALLDLSASATASLVMDALEVMSHVGTTPWGQWRAIAGSASLQAIGAPAATLTSGGSAAAAGALATTNYLTEQNRVVLTSVTTANGQAGASSAQTTAVYSTAAGRGGFEMTSRFGPSTLPTGPKLFVGMTGTTMVGVTTEPSAQTFNMAGFAKDSTDTNIQLVTNAAASGAGTKADTTIPFTNTGWFETTVWAEPGGGTIYGLLMRLDTGAIWLGKLTTDLPANGSLLFPQIIGGLSGTTGTAFILNVGSMALKMGS